MVNVYGDRVPVRPHISPRTKRLAREHLKGEQFAGNYGQRLYQYGVTDFRKVRALHCRWRQQPSARVTRLLYNRPGTPACELSCINSAYVRRVSAATRRERGQAARVD